MGILDDTAIFAAVVQEGGFSHAAKLLGLSNGLISRRIAQLEAKLGVTLITRTTRQLHLTPEGELFWQHAERIQCELDAAISLIQSSSKKPKGIIRVSAPPYFGRQYLTPIILKFLQTFSDIKIDFTLSNQKLDPIKDQLDLVIRGAGYLDETHLADSNMQMKLLVKEKIHLYASPDYLSRHGEPNSPNALQQHVIVNYIADINLPDYRIWQYTDSKNITSQIIVTPKLNCNDIESCLNACITSYGIGKFTELNARNANQQTLLQPILKNYNWGYYHLFAIYPQQHALPQRTRLLLDFIHEHTKGLIEKNFN
jgi:DNA-binding transcriptional LysR family regulator